LAVPTEPLASLWLLTEPLASLLLVTALSAMFVV